MKTNPERKIKNDIRREYAKTYPNCIFSLTNHITRLKSELAFLEADNARMRGELTSLIETCESDDVMVYGETPDRQTIRDAKAALTPDSGKDEA